AAKPGDGNGHAAPDLAVRTGDWNLVAQLLGPLEADPETLRRFPLEQGSDEEPWDVLLTLLAVDELTALQKLAERTGLRFVAEPRLHESASRFYETIPADTARRHHLAGLESDGRSMTVATAQPMQPAVF